MKKKTEIISIKEAEQVIETKIAEFCETVSKNITEANAYVTSERYNDPESNFDGYLPLLLGYQTLFYFNEQQLRNIREVCRALSIGNEVCKNIIHHRVNHIVGEGLTLTIFSKGASEDPEELANMKDDDTVKTMKDNWNAFCLLNKFTPRLRNWQERVDRDGENFVHVLPKMKDFAGKQVPVVRFIDPGRIRGGDSSDFTKKKNERYGVVFDVDDMETITSYTYYNDAGKGSDIAAAEMIHDKRNVDMDTLRGIPIFYSVIQNLQRIDKNLVNVSVLTSILSAIALIRKHALPMDSEKMNKLMKANSDGKVRNDPNTNRAKPSMKLEPGTIIDAPKGTEYETPAHGVDPTKFIAVIDKELAHVAANVVLPIEWLCATEPQQPLTSGSPVIKNFKKEQDVLYGQESPVMDLFWKVQEMMGVDAGARLEYDVTFDGPSLGDSNPLDTAREEEIAIRNGASSPQRFAAKRGNDYRVERQNMIKHRKTKQPGEVMPGDAGNTNVTGEETSTGQGGDGVTKKGGGSRGSNTPAKADK